ncbi:hypothetical protein [Escherichia coli]|uniref:hypothetical protein n=1 Tax=Escherichia coli TaxID=562 RepID=UPI001563C3E4|nr:hypothetical protein [Escherichia coli]MBN6691656.1 hypothetical protein [Escherichia coli]MDP4343425.1 hypothetical protein [Escherichia coli]MDP4369537.1 hypothetical protein [Escherichia coli]QKI52488.1 hypothetical protein FVP48_25255 [Escherichia coli O10:H32]
MKSHLIYMIGFIMDINFTELIISKQTIDYAKLVTNICSGKAMLFLGAGFSKEATNINDTNPSSSIELSHILCGLCSIPKNDNLRFSSDYYLGKVRTSS